MNNKYCVKKSTFKKPSSSTLNGKLKNVSRKDQPDQTKQILTTKPTPTIKPKSTPTKPSKPINKDSVIYLESDEELSNQHDDQNTEQPDQDQNSDLEIIDDQFEQSEEPEELEAPEEQEELSQQSRESDSSKNPIETQHLKQQPKQQTKQQTNQQTNQQIEKQTKQPKSKQPELIEKKKIKVSKEVLKRAIEILKELDPEQKKTLLELEKLLSARLQQDITNIIDISAIEYLIDSLDLNGKLENWQENRAKQDIKYKAPVIEKKVFHQKVNLDLPKSERLPDENHRIFNTGKSIYVGAQQVYKNPQLLEKKKHIAFKNFSLPKKDSNVLQKFGI